MELSNDLIRNYSKRLMLSRMRILCTNGFYGLLIMHLKFTIDESTETSWTDGIRVGINPNFLDELSDDELDYVLQHEILHIVLKHGKRALNDTNFDQQRYDFASDIIVNSIILQSNNMDTNSISLKNHGGIQAHKAPNGHEGYEYSVEELYQLLPCTAGSKNSNDDQKPSDSGNGEGNSSDDADGDANSVTAPDSTDDDNSNDNDADSDNHFGSISSNAAGKSKYTGKSSLSYSSNNNSKATNSKTETGWDDHSKLNDSIDEDREELEKEWDQRLIDAAKTIEIRKSSNGVGNVPAFAQRILNNLRKPQTDWRTILNEFVQEEINDYSFAPPDRRFDDSPFFLPDFNEKEDVVKNVLFMIDTSGSMSDDMITAAYSEIVGAIEQFGGKLSGWLGFFDAAVIDPIPFESIDEFEVIRPYGGGGTRFDIIFKYVEEKMQDNTPTSIIILTDGYAPFPKEEETNGIPVLWIINNEKVKPPFGRIARITI